MTSDSTARQPDFLSEDDEPIDRLIVDVDGYEGPLDLLLTLARDQKVDLAKISILELSEQYLAFIKSARDMRLELAADYLVMAAWLAYLKSRLLLPDPPEDDEPSGEELAEQLALRLRRLEAIRSAAEHLELRNRRDRDVFGAGERGGFETVTETRQTDTLYELLKAYGQGRVRTSVREIRLGERPTMSLEAARELLTRYAASLPDWAPLDRFLIQFAVAPEKHRTALASSFAASLELAREGTIQLRQDRAFAPLLVRSKPNSEAMPA
ncbi:MAG: ScpA family protein [Pseudomonadota bacterium]